MYDVNYFIAKFEAIPEEEFITQDLKDFFNRKCAYGHCGVDTSADSATIESLHLSNIFGHIYISDDNPFFYYFGLSWKVIKVNDGGDDGYKQPTPKQRILAALYDIRDKELSEANVNTAKEIIEVEKIENVLV